MTLLFKIALFVMMGGFILAAVELWHLLHFNEKVKQSKTKRVLCWAGFAGSIAFAIVCGAFFVRSFLSTPSDQQREALLQSLKDTLKQFGDHLTPTDREALLYEIEQTEKEIQAEKEIQPKTQIQPEKDIQAKIEMRARLQEISELLPEVKQQLDTIDNEREKMIRSSRFVLSNPSYQQLISAQQGWQKELNNLIKEQEQLIAVLSS